LVGKYLVTTGTDSQMKVWDVRTYQPIHEYWNPMPATKVSISQKGLLAVGWSNQIQVKFKLLEFIEFSDLERLVWRETKETLLKTRYS